MVNITQRRYWLALLVFMVCVPGSYASDDAWSRSVTLEMNGQYEAAARSLETILQQDPKNEFAQLRSGWLYYLAGKYSTSIKYYQVALKLNKQSLEARLGLMLPLMAQERWREAAQFAEAVIRESSLNYYAHLRLMICEEGLKDWSRLRDHALRLIRYYPGDASFQVYLARAYRQLGDKERARAAYSRVLERYPGHVEASLYLSE
jgi:tetratricopeptide (TPR) repeat protein